MISPVLKDFIERNVDLLESDVRRFLAKAMVRLNYAQFEDLIVVLTESNINFSKEREFMLINKLGFIFPVVPDGEPLIDALKDNLFVGRANTFFGWNVYELAEFVWNNEEEWKDDMSLYEEAGIVYVRTGYDR